MDGIRDFKHLVPCGATDDPEFIGQLNALIAGVVAVRKPNSFHVVEIKNWFDHKWLGFSGTGAIDFPVQIPNAPNITSKVIYRQGNLTLPPFVPNRILSQRAFERRDSEYVETLSVPPHSVFKQQSEQNVRQPIARSFGGNLLMWFSSGSSTNGKGSVMVYDLAGRNPVTWFAGFAKVKDGRWLLASVRGIDQNWVESRLLDGCVL